MDWGSCLYHGGDPKLGDTATLDCIPIVFLNIVQGFLMFAGAIAVLMFIYAGIRFVTSGGDAKRVAGARQILTYAIVGLVVVILSFAIVYFVGYITGATSCLNAIAVV